MRLSKTLPFTNPDCRLTPRICGSCMKADSYCGRPEFELARARVSELQFLLSLLKIVIEISNHIIYSIPAALR
jgi:hypothetical protein